MEDFSVLQFLITNNLKVSTSKEKRTTCSSLFIFLAIFQSLYWIKFPLLKKSKSTNTQQQTSFVNLDKVHLNKIRESHLPLFNKRR